MGSERQQEKARFCEQKVAKTLLNWAILIFAATGPHETKAFTLLFSKKRPFSPLLSPGDRPIRCQYNSKFRKLLKNSQPKSVRWPILHGIGCDGTRLCPI
jgi:hypothetical protein